MAIKVRVKKYLEKTYPYIAQDKDDNEIVIFYKKDTAIVLSDEEGNYLGESEYRDESQYRLLTKPIIISNY